MKKVEAAFTLAEVMITIAVIGIVAAITMPILKREVTMRVDSSREANIALKVTKAMENMSVAGDFGVFNSTDEFVDNLQKYLKIVKRCDADHLSDCWPTRIITGSEGTKFDVNNAKTGEDLHVEGYTTNNVGLVLADGASIILTYDQNFVGFSPDTFFQPIKKELYVGFGETKEFPYYRSTVTEPIDFVMDVNGKSAPNQETEQNGDKIDYHDIRSFKKANFTGGVCPGTMLPDRLCIKLFEPQEVPAINCSNPYVDEDKKQFCEDTTSSINYYAGAKKLCHDLDMEINCDYTRIDNLINAGKIPQGSKAISYSYHNCRGNQVVTRRDAYVLCTRQY